MSDALVGGPPRVMHLHEGTDRDTKYLGVVLVSDALVAESLGGAAGAEEHARELVQAANRILEKSSLSPRLRVVLVDHVVLDPQLSPQSSSDEPVDSADLLLGFNFWATEAGLPEHDVHILLTSLTFSDTELGATFLGAACMYGYNGLVMPSSPSLKVPLEQLLVHELGHLVGMNHDGQENDCPASGYLMASTAVPGGLSTPRFSDCSRAEFASFVADSYSSRCLSDVPVPLIKGSCGDGVRSDDEMCDCGNTESCASVDPCCRPDCSLASGAVCSGFNETDSCCTESCQIAEAGEVCRPARDACDSAEVCTGQSSFCPGDSWPRSGSSCVDATGRAGACFRGNCVSRTAQCLEGGAQLAVELTGPRESCIDVDDSCSEAVCWYETNQMCLPLGRLVSDGVPCGDSAQCLSGRCVPVQEIEECPLSGKDMPGRCGCDQADIDEDQDGVMSCLDACPADPNKVMPGQCGCGVPESDDCKSSSPDTDSTGVSGSGDGQENNSEGGCSCNWASSRSSSVWGPILLGVWGLPWLRRKGTARFSQEG